MLRLVRRDHEVVDEEIIDEFSTQRTGIPQIMRLDRCGPTRHEIETTSFRVPIQIEQNVDASRLNPLDNVVVTFSVNIVKFVKGCFQPSPQGTFIVPTIRKGANFKLRSIMEFR